MLSQRVALAHPTHRNDRDRIQEHQEQDPGVRRAGDRRGLLGLGLLTYWRYQALVGGKVAVELRTLNNYARSELGLWIAKHVDDLRALSNANTIQAGLSRAPTAMPGSARIGAREIDVFLRRCR